MNTNPFVDAILRQVEQQENPPLETRKADVINNNNEAIDNSGTDYDAMLENMRTRRRNEVFPRTFTEKRLE